MAGIVCCRSCALNDGLTPAMIGTWLMGSELGARLSEVQVTRMVRVIEERCSREHVRSYEDIGRVFEVSRERVRQIEYAALRLLRHMNGKGGAEFPIDAIPHGTRLHHMVFGCKPLALCSREVVL